MSTANNSLRVVVASEGDIPAIANLTQQTFSAYDFERDIGNLNTPESLAEAPPRFLRAYHDHLAETGLQSAIKCIHTDPTTGEESLAACASWFIFPTPRTEENVVKPNYLTSGDWLPGNVPGDNRRKRAWDGFAPLRDLRAKWSRGRGVAFLQYMTTHEDWRRMGAATMCVRWGLEKCQEYGIPAYLETSPPGRLVYEKLGFEVVDEFDDGTGHITPVMMWWPLGTKEQDKKALPPPR